MSVWVEYAEYVEWWRREVAANPTPDTYRARWKARLEHPSWAEKREAFLWYTGNRCEHCHTLQKPADLQLHHLHYETLWYESNLDLELLCPSCHYKADQKRERDPVHMDFYERAIRYMEQANRFSGQPDWPVTFQQALEHVTDSA